MKNWNIATIGFFVIIVMAISNSWEASESWGQHSERKPMLADGYTDYFLKNVNAGASTNVRNVNHFHLKPAFRHMRSGKPERALPDLQFILRWVPNHPLGLSLMATYSQMTQRPNLAIGRFEQAIYLFPQYGLTYAQYGKFFYDLKDMEKAKNLLNKAIALDSKLSAAYGWLSLVYYSEGDLEQAEKVANKAKELGYKGALPKR